MRGLNWGRCFSSIAITIFVASIFLLPRRAGSQQNTSTGSGSLHVAGHIFRADNGQPIRNAVVTLVTLPVGGQFIEPVNTLTDGLGAYRVDDLEPALYTVDVQGGPYFASSHAQGDLRKGKSSDSVDVKLEPIGIVSGTVVDENGVPLPGVYVRVLKEANLKERDDSGSVMTDDQGAFQLRVGPGNRRMAVSLDVVGPPAAYYPDAPSESGAGRVRVQAGIETTGIRIKLSDPVARSAAPSGSGSVTGRVLRADTEAPLPRALVILHPNPGPAPSNGRESLYAFTNENGNYKFSSVSPGNYYLTVNATGFVYALPGFPVPSLTVATSPLDLIEIRLQPAGDIAGAVTGEAGEPLWGIYVTVFRKDGARESAVRYALTEALGNFHVAVPAPGQYYLRVGPPPMGASTQLGRATKYYPSVDTDQEAQAIEVQPGISRQLQFTLPIVRSFSVSISIRPLPSDPNTIYSFAIRKTGTIQNPSRSTPELETARLAFSPGGSTVRFRNVPDGTYTVVIQRANVRYDANGRPASSATGNPLASLAIQVKGSDVNLEIPISETPPNH